MTEPTKAIVKKSAAELLKDVEFKRPTTPEEVEQYKKDFDAIVALATKAAAPLGIAAAEQLEQAAANVYDENMRGLIDVWVGDYGSGQAPSETAIIKRNEKQLALPLARRAVIACLADIKAQLQYRGMQASRFELGMESFNAICGVSDHGISFANGMPVYFDVPIRLMDFAEPRSVACVSEDETIALYMAVGGACEVQARAPS